MEASQVTETGRMSATDKQILIFSVYRDAELRGARLLFNLIGHMKDGDSQLKMAKHLADETRHAWLWTRRIADLGGTPLMLADGYQRRLGLRRGEDRREGRVRGGGLNREQHRDARRAGDHSPHHRRVTGAAPTSGNAACSGNSPLRRVPSGNASTRSATSSTVSFLT